MYAKLIIGFEFYLECLIIDMISSNIEIIMKLRHCRIQTIQP